VRCRALVARQAHNLEVGGSIPPSANAQHPLGPIPGLFPCESVNDVRIAATADAKSGASRPPAGPRTWRIAGLGKARGSARVVGDPGAGSGGVRPACMALPARRDLGLPGRASRGPWNRGDGSTAGLLRPFGRSGRGLASDRLADSPPSTTAGLRTGADMRRLSRLGGFGGSALLSGAGDLPGDVVQLALGALARWLAFRNGERLLQGEVGGKPDYRE
jgi:hypothetical protein